MSAIEQGKSLSKLMIPINLFERFGSLAFITSIKGIYMTTNSSNYFKLTNIHPIKETTWIAIQEGKIYNIKIIAFIINCGGNITVRSRPMLIQKRGLGI